MCAAVALGNDGLAERCRQRAREGLWLLYREWAAGDDGRVGLWELIEQLEQDEARRSAFARESTA
jgi:hypothetical protein